METAKAMEAVVAVKKARSNLIDQINNHLIFSTGKKPERSDFGTWCNGKPWDSGKNCLFNRITPDM
jgi:hypothetical protein